MTIKLGMFTMPFHHPARDYTTILEEDQDAIVLADQLGFSEAFVGEHFSSWSERITSPLIFLATVLQALPAKSGGSRGCSRSRHRRCARRAAAPVQPIGAPLGQDREVSTSGLTTLIGAQFA
jgi:hypothetical protein